MNKLIKNTSIYTIGNILPTAASFFLLPLYTNYLTVNEYGIIEAVFGINVILTIFFTLALDRSFYRLYYDYDTQQEREQFIGTIFWSPVVIGGIFLLFFFLFPSVFQGIYKSIDFYPYFALAIATAYFLSFSNVPKTYYQVIENAKTFVSISVLEFIFNNIFIIIFVVFLQYGALGYLLGFFVGSISLLPIYFYIITKNSIFTIDFVILKNALSFSAPIIPGLIFAWVINLSNRIFIERYFSLYHVGIFSLSSKISMVMLILTSAIFKAYNPHFYKQANSEEDIDIIKKNLKRTHESIIYLIIYLGFIISLISSEVISTLFHSSYHEAAKLVPLLVIGFIFSQISGLMNLSFYQHKKTIILMLIAISTAIITLLSNYLFVPIYGSYGAAYASIISFFLLFLLTSVLSKKYYYIAIDWVKIIIFMALSITILFINNLFDSKNILLIILIKTNLILFVSYILLLKIKKEFGFSILGYLTKNRSK